MTKRITVTILGQTPLPDDYRKDLIPTHVQTLGELNELEAANISKAVGKYLFGKKQWSIFYPKILNQIHKDMLHEVWKWAGTY